MVNSGHGDVGVIRYQVLITDTFLAGSIRSILKVRGQNVTGVKKDRF